MPAKLSLIRHSLRILRRCKCKLVSQNTRYYFGRVDRAGKIELWKQQLWGDTNEHNRFITLADERTAYVIQYIFAVDCLNSILLLLPAANCRANAHTNLIIHWRVVFIKWSVHRDSKPCYFFADSLHLIRPTIGCSIDWWEAAIKYWHSQLVCPRSMSGITTAIGGA